MRVRRGLAAAAVLLASLLLTSCATIPVSSPVKTAVPQQAQDNPVAFVPNGPVANASPQEIVSGFVRAQGEGDRYTVAREFLTAEAARRWRPNDSVLVHAAAWSTSAADGDQVVLTVPAIAGVDGTGRYGTLSGSQRLDYTLQRVGGQWRISRAPDGVVLSQRLFPSVFTSVQLQFFTPRFTRLVPDVRWFPISRTGNYASRVVAAALAGQAPVLADVTAPMFPAGTEAAAPVRSSGGVVTVSVRAAGGALDSRVTDHAQQALALSLGISTAAVRLVVNGALAPSAPRPDVEQLSTSSPVVVAGGRFGSLTAQGTVSVDRDLGAGVARLRPRAVTVSTRQHLAAVLTADRRVAVVGAKGSTSIVDSRPGLIAPTVDQDGWTYSMPRDQPAELWATKGGQRKRLGASLGSGTEVTSIEASSDGTRVLILSRSDSGWEASVAGVLRTADGTPTGLTTARVPIALDGADAIAATWIDQTRIAVLVQEGNGQNVIQQQLGGITAPLGPLSNARSIVGATRPEDLRALLRTGDLVRWSGSLWEPGLPAVEDIDVLAVQR